MSYGRMCLALTAILLLLVVSVPAHAQVTTATLVGLVRDNSGAVIPGASVVATHEGTGVAREGISDANGEFVFSALPSGPYTVRIELTGFKTISQRGIQLGAGQTLRQTFTLEVGAMSETVTVTGDAPLVETATSLQADSLGSQEVRELPVNRRNIQNLIGLTAGVVITGTGSAGGSGGVHGSVHAIERPESVLRAFPKLVVVSEHARESLVVTGASRDHELELDRCESECRRSRTKSCDGCPRLVVKSRGTEPSFHLEL